MTQIAHVTCSKKKAFNIQGNIISKIAWKKYDERGEKWKTSEKKLNKAKNKDTILYNVSIVESHLSSRML